MEFSLSVSDNAGRAVVSVGGELDVYTAPELEERLAALIEEGRVAIIVDLTDVSFMDSTGLGLLIKVLKWTREKGGSLDVVANSEKTLKVFRITGLDGVISLHSSVDEALGA